MKRKPLKKVSEKGLKKKEEKKKLLEKDKEFYLKIWNSRPHVCFETGKFLGNEPLLTMFHHVLPKAKYPSYRHSEKNIVLLHPDVHNQVETNLSKCPKVAELTSWLLELANY